MASAAPQQQPSSQRRSSQPQAPAPQSPVARSTTSEDSQTIFVAQPEQPQHSSGAPLPGSREDPEVKTCWICQCDSTEDTPTTSPWRDPCPCALVAHEECLLDWIADIEAPKNNRNARSILGRKLECPQCKSEIKLSRPRNPIVDVVRTLERATAQLLLPTGLAFLTGVLYSGSVAFGKDTIYTIFGGKDGYRILKPLFQSIGRPPLEMYLGRPQIALQQLMKTVLDHLVHWRVYVGLPLIMPMIILSRTRLADSILPVLPVLFFATGQAAGGNGSMDLTAWPPSAGLCFSLLPYARAAYNTYYDRVWAAKMRRWSKEIQPRSTSEGAAEVDFGNEAEEMRAEVADENVFEVRIDGGIWEDWQEAPAEVQQQQPARRRAQAPPLVQPPVQDDAQADPPPNMLDDRPLQVVDPQVDELLNEPAAPPPRPNAAPQPAAPAVQQPERRLSFSPTAIAETILGALFFPTLAGLSGDLLNLVLPSSLTYASKIRALQRPSILTTLFDAVNGSAEMGKKFGGRVFVGGCQGCGNGLCEVEDG
ncbi:hypothetical protein LTR97_007017 [Elasticomyces elasticus]|uniref:RING-CH-type domain-containing protein n=1 Tax=Elasticomyces elasticus TaxID=574655 RepID=A0AAN7ZN12_9PEZI|nr:hypothetical protein LTR97_007017 [Elasticomyces elasticus]